MNNPFSTLQPNYERVNMLVRVALWMVIICIMVVVFSPRIGLDEFAKGAISLILGKFLAHVDMIYGYEFGKTRSEGAKDQQLTDLAREVPAAPASVSTDKMEVKATGDVNVTEAPK